MKKILLVLVLTLSTVGRAQELVTLTAPITHPNVTTFRIDKVTIDVTNQALYLQWLGNTGESFAANYPTPAPVDHPSQPTGATLLHTINTANFTVNSLVKRIEQELQADGYIGAGAISGSVQ
jgi:hypothetical protein